MRTEQEMFDLILDFAWQDERVRVVAMNGSRANPNVPRDAFQDYDIVFVVTEMDSFLASDAWLSYFGRRIIMQKPEGMELFPSEGTNRFSYLMLFEDGNRIDHEINYGHDAECCYLMTWSARLIGDPALIRRAM